MSGTVVVVGGGVTGLAAAWALATAPGERSVVLLEAGDRTGGALAPVRLELPGAGAPLVLDGGAESLLARRPEAVALAREVGLGDDLVTPAAARAAVLSRAALHPLPGGTLLGVPGDPEALRGLLTDAEVARAGAEVLDGPVADDVDVAGWVAGRLGPAVVDRLVEPLLGGVYAGSAAGTSLRAALPPLARAAAAGTSVLDAVSAATTAGAGAGGPVFAGVRGGVWRLAEALTRALVAAGVEVRLHAPVAGLHRAGTGWRLDVEGVGPVEAAAVVLALPAAPTAALLADVAPAAARGLAGVPAASLALVTAALPAGSLTGAADLAGLSGVLVPPAEGRLVKAMTFSSAKWDWVARAAAPHEVLRLSVGRYGDDAVLARDDAALAGAVVADAADALGVPLEPLATAVSRWTAALPQYRVGHLDVVAAVRAAVAEQPGLAVAGATYDGVGVPACIASGRRAALEVLAGTAAAG